jgi:hypothetical protein
VCPLAVKAHKLHHVALQLPNFLHQRVTEKQMQGYLDKWAEEGKIPQYSPRPFHTIFFFFFFFLL